MAGSIAVLDSGIGGVPYVRAAREVLADRSFLYVADTANFPYGRKTPQEIRLAVRDLVGRLVQGFQLEAAVLACNTASVVALRDLRDHFSIPFVGVVPAVKPAAAGSQSQRIGVLATPRTVQDVYLAALIERFATHADVVVQAAPDLVDFVESRLFTASASERENAVRRAVAPLVDAKVDRIVLGCTHFVHLRGEIERVVGPGIQVVDSVGGVTRQLLRVVGGNAGAEAHGTEQLNAGRDRLYVTSGPPPSTHGDCEQYRAVAASAGMELAGII